MDKKITLMLLLAAVSLFVTGQGEVNINRTDQKGRKQGEWIKRYSDGSIQYEGTFRDDHPVGELKRYTEDKKLQSVMTYSNDGKEVTATHYHPNGFIASRGKYVNQLKEGKWQFFSYFYEGYLISEEFYLNNKRNGPSFKFYTDSTIFEKVTYVNDKKEGEWLQNYPDGKKFLRSNYSNDQLDGKFEVWYENGKQEMSGSYKNNFRDGTWQVFNEDGSLKYKIDYELGNTGDKQMDIDATNLMDKLEKNQGRIPDPEKTGDIKR